MRLAILSDIHDHVWRLAAALEHVRGTEALICCGDLCSPFIVHQIGREYANPVHIVFGNNDADLYRISAVARLYPHVALHGELFEGEFGGRPIAVQHFDNIARPLAASGRYDAVFFGHNHRRETSRAGGTLLVNPGPILGAAFRADGSREDVASSYAVYDTDTGDVHAFQVLADGGVAPL
ncbi:MAG: metallophosphoesterase family protein [Acidobacteriota bacterium]|nr:metallophosphoesterase family protein [Acidobacteriota bacterium]